MRHSPAKPRIVMVDDEPDFQLILRQWLSPRYETISLPNGEGILEELSELEPDLLILDVGLPGPNGFKLCHKIRTVPRFSALPILFLTASKANDDFMRNLEVGGSAYLNKPVERGPLLATIDELLSAKGAV